MRFFTTKRRQVVPMGVQCGTAEWTKSPLVRAKFHPISANSTKIAEAYPLRDYNKSS